MHCLVQTTQGGFVVADRGESLTDARQSYAERESDLISELGKLELCQLPDYKGELCTDSSYVHQAGHYYQVWRVVGKHRQTGKV